MHYCLNCREYTDESHECENKYVIIISEDMRGIADRIYELGLQLASATCTVSENPGYGSQNIRIDIEFKEKYPEGILTILPTGWEWYETCQPIFTVDRWGHKWVENGPNISGIIYRKNIRFKDIEKAERKAKRIMNEMLTYLNTGYDSEGVKSVLTLYHSGNM